jgi:antitoxin ParD1/3/4
MEIVIPDELKSFVSSGVASGRFRSEDEAIREGLNLLKEREQKLDALRADLQLGIDQLDAGLKQRLDVDVIKARGQELLKSQQAQS